MRKFLMGLTVLAGAVAVTPGADAAPRFVDPVPVASGQPAVQAVQYYGGREEWRHREWRRREAFERFRRHEQWRHRHYEAYQHGRGGWYR